MDQGNAGKLTSKKKLVFFLPEFRLPSGGDDMFVVAPDSKNDSTFRCFKSSGCACAPKGLGGHNFFHTAASFCISVGLQSRVRKFCFERKIKFRVKILAKLAKSSENKESIRIARISD